MKSLFSLIFERFLKKDIQKKPVNVPEATTESRVTRPFGLVISDAEEFITQKSYKNALLLYRMLAEQLAGSGELMKIQFVREKIETLIRLIRENPTPETMDIIEEENRAAEERYQTTIREAEHYFRHNLYTEALFLYRKLAKEWASSGDTAKKAFLQTKIQIILDLDDGTYSDRDEDEENVPDESLITAQVEQVPPADSDEPDSLSRIVIPAFEGPDVQVPQELSGLGENERTLDGMLLEAENYFSHELYKEALYLYRKIQKTWAGSIDDEKKIIIEDKIRVLSELVEDPFRIPSQPGDTTQLAYLDEDGTISDTPLEGFEEGPGYSRFARSLSIATLKNKTFLNIVYLIIFAAGIYAMFNIPVENMPSVDMGEVYITTYYYGASAEDVENLITTQIEKAIEGIENVQFVESRTHRNRSSVHVKFVDDADYSELFSRVRLQVLNIRSKLPEGCEDPKFLFIDTHWWISVIRVNLFGQASESSRKDMADRLKTELKAIEGVRDIEISGQSKNEFHVSLSPEKLRGLGVTFAEVVDALRSAGQKIPTGNFSTDSSEFILDSGSDFSRQEDVLNVIVRKDGFGNFVRIRDVVTSAMMGSPDPMLITSINGEDTTSLTVRKEDRANSLKIARQVKQICDRFADKHKADGLRIAYTNDSTKEINDSISILNGNLLMGIGLVVLTLWYTLGLRNAIFAALGIPFSFLCTLIAMKVAGISINSINLFAFILVSGIIVDDAIVVIENVYRHQQMGKPLRIAVVDGVAEIFWPVFNSMLTTVVAFLPMLLITGPVGSFLSMIPIAVSFALFASILESTTFLPVHIFEYGPKAVDKIEADATSDEEKSHKKDIVSRVWNGFEKILDLFLKHRWKAMTSIAFLFFVALAIAGLSLSGIYPLIKVKFFPGNYIRYHVTVALPSSTPITRTDAIVRDISRFILGLGEKQADSVSGTAGFYEEEDYSIQGGSQYGQAVVTMPEKDTSELPDNPGKDPVKHLDFVRKKLRTYLVEQYPNPDERPVVKVFPESNGIPSGKAVSLRISGENLERELQVSDRIMEFMRQNPELKDLTEITDDRASNVNVVRYTPSQESAYDLGIPPGRITEMIAGALNGITVGTFQTPSEEVDLKVRVARKQDMEGYVDSGLGSPQDIMDIPLVEHSAAPIFLRDVAGVEYSSEPDSRGRYNGKSSVRLTADIRSGSDLTSKRVEFLVSRYFESMAGDYPDITLIFAGESETTGKTFSTLYIGLVVALVAIYLILALQFGDYVQPFIVLTAVSFAIIGVTFGMLLTRSLFTLGSLMAVVGLAGVTVNNSLILIDFINIRINEGKTMRQAVKDACRARIRPVLLTTITTIMGLLPMAIGIPYKSVEWSPMATTFVAGLFASTVLTLLMIPVEYELATLVKTKIKERF